MALTAVDWIRKTLAGDHQGLREEPPRQGFNPHPSGVMQSDGTSYLLLRLFVAHPRVWFTAGELQRRSRRSRQSVSWALQYLRARQVIVETEDTSRNPRYRKYRMAVDLTAEPPQSPPPPPPSHEVPPKQVPMDFKF